MKKLIYYITDHGRGHATRSVAIIRELQKLNIEIIIRNSNANNFLQNSLPDIKIIPGLTDIGPDIKSNGISIDKQKTEITINNWIDRLNKISKAESEIIKKIEPDLIISDISAMPFLAATKTNTNSIAISNFSWYDVLKFLPSNKLEFLKDAYDKASFAIQIPLGTSMEHFKNKQKIGLVSRIPSLSKKKIREHFKIMNNEIVVLFALGRSDIEVNCKYLKNVKTLSMNTTVSNSNHIQLSDWNEGQEIVASADLVICKCGYGLISECLTNGIPFCYVSDDNHIEQQAISNELYKMGLDNRISFDDLKNFEINEKYKKIMATAQKKSLDNESATNLILQHLKN